MKISKKDALMWFSFFAQLPEEEELMPKQMQPLRRSKMPSMPEMKN